MATRYRRDKQKLQIGGQKIQWLQDTAICSFCLFRRYLVAIVLSDLRFVSSVYLVGIFVARIWSDLRFVASVYLVGTEAKN
jgi:hypothetical protein